MNQTKISNLHETYRTIANGEPCRNYGYTIYAEQNGDSLAVYSYGKHHILAIVSEPLWGNRTAIMNPTRPSVTTAKHRNGLARELQRNGYTITWVSNIEQVKNGETPKTLTIGELKNARI